MRLTVSQSRAAGRYDAADSKGWVIAAAARSPFAAALAAARTLARYGGDPSMLLSVRCAGSPLLLLRARLVLAARLPEPVEILRL